MPYGFVWPPERSDGSNDKGAAEPEKEQRPCVIYKIRKNKDIHQNIVSLMPISHVPQEHGKGMKVPSEKVAALQLDDTQSWIVTSKGNEFAWPEYSTPDLQPYTAGTLKGVFVQGVMDPGLFNAMASQAQGNLHKGEFKKLYRHEENYANLASADGRRLSEDAVNIQGARYTSAGTDKVADLKKQYIEKQLGDYDDSFDFYEDAYLSSQDDSDDDGHSRGH